MRDLFIDFENVHKSGLEGIETLSRFDRVFLFYSDAAESIDIDQIVNCKARLKFVKAGFYSFCVYNMGQEQGRQFYASIKKNYAKMKQIVELAS